MKQAYLNFLEECEYDNETGTQLCSLLCDLLSARTLMVCPFLIHWIKDYEDPVRLKASMETNQNDIENKLVP